MKNRTFRTLMILLLVAVLGAGGVYAAVRYGTQADPLITLSYLTDVKEPELADAYAVKADGSALEASIRDWKPSILELYWCS